MPGAERFGQVLFDAVASDRPQVADEQVKPFRAQHRRQSLGRGVHPLHPAGGLAGEGFFDGLDFGVDQRKLSLEERGASEDEVFASHLDPFFDPFDSLKPNELRLTAPVGNDGGETPLAARSGIVYPCHAAPELNERRLPVADLGDPVDACAVDVAEWEIPEQVAHRADAQLPFEELRPRLAHARYELDAVVQIVFHSTNITIIGRFRASACGKTKPAPVDAVFRRSFSGQLLRAASPGSASGASGRDIERRRFVTVFRSAAEQVQRFVAEAVSRWSSRRAGLCA